MKLIGTCLTCKFHSNRHCHSPKIREANSDDDTEENGKGDDSLAYSYNEDGAFETGYNFGCVHWTKRVVDSESDEEMKTVFRNARQSGKSLTMAGLK